MSVRFKPLIALCGVFLVVGAVGLSAFVLVASRSGNPLAKAKTEQATKQYDKALIDYQRARQLDPKNPEIAELIARMYVEWAVQVPARAEDLRVERYKVLADAAKLSKTRLEPRRLLLADALREEEMGEAIAWAAQVLALDPQSADARYALVVEALDAQPPKLADATRHAEALIKREPDRPRALWVRSAVAGLARDEETLAVMVEAARALKVEAVASPGDRLAMVRLMAEAASKAAQPDRLAPLIESINTYAKLVADDPDYAPARITQLGRCLDRVASRLAEVAGPRPAGRLAEPAAALEEVTTATYKKSVEPAARPDLRAYLAYAEHLLRRDRRQACMEAVDKALTLDQSKKVAWLPTAMNLREVGVKAALVDLSDPARVKKATPYIEGLIAGTEPTFRGAGHLFQGLIDLEAAGVAEPPAGKVGAKADPRRQTEALGHLQIAATSLPHVATAQALYGVALVLAREPALGRQYLQKAMRMGGLDPRYQVWAAWSLIQAGYPEDAAPIVAPLADEAGEGQPNSGLASMLHLLKGEIYQARRTPEDLNRARDEYKLAVPSGQMATPALQMRMAQIEIMLGETEAGNRRLAQIQAAQGGSTADALRVMVLREGGKVVEARKLLAEARLRSPDSDELVGLDAAMLVDANQAPAADAVLAEFLAKYPTHLDVRMIRARVLAAPPLSRRDEARKVLMEAAEGDQSAPLVQVALMDLQAKDYAAAAKTIAKLRSRWKEIAAADLLDAQLASAQGNPRDAAGFLDEALRKDPSNKVALFWKARLDERAGDTAGAAKVFASIAQGNPTREVADGVSLTQAAEWSLATIALEQQDVDGAIARFTALLKTGVGPGADRQLRWQIAVAEAAKGRYAEGKAAIDALLADPKTTPAERLQAALFCRRNRDEAGASRLLDIVLKQYPSDPQAVALRSLMLADANKPGEAVALIGRSLAAGPMPPSIHLMRAAAENLAPPAATQRARTLAALDAGLAAHPDAVELLRARYLAMKLAKDAGALAFIVERTEGRPDPDGRLRRLLIDTYGDEQDFAKAEKAARDLLKAEPKDRRLAAKLLFLVSTQATLAAGRGDKDAEKALNSETLNLVRRFRAEFPADLAFPRAECELAARKGDFDRALTLAKDLDKVDAFSVEGPMLRAQLYAAKGWTAQVAESYAEALARSPRRGDIRLALGRVALSMQKFDQAEAQADAVLQAQPDQPVAIILKARSLAFRDGPEGQVASRREEAVALLEKARQADPRNVDFPHQLAEIQRLLGRRADAVACLEASMKRNPADDAGLAQLVQYLAETRGADEADGLARAEAIGKALGAGDSDKSGRASLSMAVGYHAAGRTELALPWAERAARKLDAPAVHMTYGDILLTRAEATADAALARADFVKADDEYGRVIKAQGNAVEAINNKAWILHRYLNNNPAALELAEGLARRAGTAGLPAAFLDTLGSIQATAGRPRDAERSFLLGLKKEPEMAMLNYHMGKLLAADKSRSVQAAEYLAKARGNAVGLPAAVVAEVDEMLTKVSR